MTFTRGVTRIYVWCGHDVCMNDRGVIRKYCGCKFDSESVCDCKWEGVCVKVEYLSHTAHTLYTRARTHS